MPTDTPLRLLMFFASPNDAQELINQLRNQGYPTRAHQLTSGAALSQLAGEETWDLLICEQGESEQEWQQLIAQARQQSVPALLLSDACDEVREQAFACGASDVIGRDNFSHLLHRTLREIEHRRTALEKVAMQAAHTELQARYQLLMGGSQDAIAYLTDGMHIDANEAYARQFGFQDCDELACMPVIDLVAPDQQERFKRFLREYSQHSQDEAELDTAIQTQDGQIRAICMQFAPANYEGEACTQVVIRAQAAATGSVKRDFVPSAARQLQLSGPRSSPVSVCYLHLENLSALRESVGVLKADEAITQLEGFLTEHCSQDVVSGQITQDGFALLYLDANAAQALPRVEELIAAIKAHIIDIEGRSVRCEFSAMLVNLDADDASISTSIDLAFRAIVDILQDDARQIIDIYTPPAAPIGLHTDAIDLDRLHGEERLVLYYQPIISLRGEPGEYYEVSCVLQDVGAEALDLDTLAQRLLNPHGASGFDRWLLTVAIHQLRKKRNQQSDTRLIVNLTASCLRDQKFAGWLEVTLKAANVPPECLVLQLSETAVNASIKPSQRLFGEINKLGCSCSISDFGIGSHGSAMLQHISARMLKLDRTIVAKGSSEAKQRQRLQGLLQEATQAGAASIVPEVCTASTLATLWQLGASFIQGDYLQQPSTTMDYEFAEIA